MYTSPAVTTYSNDELTDLIGPVQTQYCELADVNATPDTILQTKTDITITLDFALCSLFSTADITLIDSSNVRLTSQTFSVADGMISGTLWTLPVFDFGLTLDPGDYTLEVILMDSNGDTSQPQFTSFTVL